MRRLDDVQALGGKATQQDPFNRAEPRNPRTHEMKFFRWEKTLGRTSPDGEPPSDDSFGYPPSDFRIVRELRGDLF